MASVKIDCQQNRFLNPGSGRVKLVIKISVLVVAQERGRLHQWFELLQHQGFLFLNKPLRQGSLACIPHQKNGHFDPFCGS